MGEILLVHKLYKTGHGAWGSYYTGSPDKKSMNIQDVKIVSLNVKGISNPVKRSKILSKMKRENAQIVLLQETHLSVTEHEKMRRLGYTRAYYSSYKSGRRRGVIILISQKIPFEYISEISDKEGRYIMVTGKINNAIITICNVYVPPGSSFGLYRNMFDLMVKATGLVICGGDWNLRLNPELDASKKVPTTSLHKKVNLMVELGILDIWRDFYPLRRDYTFYSFPHNTYSRIDYFFVFKRDRSKISFCDIGSTDLSDHASVSCGVHISDNPRKTSWRLNTSALNKPSFVAQMRKEIKQFLEENDKACTNLDKLIKDTQNPWIKTQLKIWNKVKGEYQLNDKIQIIQWCAFDPGFRPNLTDNSFKSWISKGITTFYSLTENGK